jgi:ZIP family zinc transporter
MMAIGTGGAVLALLHWVIPHTHLIEEDGLFDAAMLKSAYLLVLGLILHDVPEGFAMANSFLAAPSLGVFVAIGIALHNIPEEFAMALPLVALKRHRFLFGAATVSALAEPAGALVGLLAVEAAPRMTPLFMGAAAGAMIFVSLHELIPMAQRYHRVPDFLLGGGFSVVVYALLSLAIP